MVCLPLALALFLVSLATHQINWALVAILPALLGGLLLFVRERPFAAQVTETAIELSSPEVRIPYDSLRYILAPLAAVADKRRRPRQFPMVVGHTGGEVHIPARLNIPSGDVYAFLERRFPPTAFERINAAVDDWAKQQVDKFGLERVWCSVARNPLGKAKRPLARQLAAWAILLTGLAWLASCYARRTIDIWMGLSVIACLVGMVMLLDASRRFSATQGIRGWKNASLIISPRGFALVQGDLQGELQWPEVLKIELVSRPGSFFWTTATAGPGIVVTVAGTRITIADIYNHPLPSIYDEMMKYWK
jgi:hypothetical protein